MSLIPLIIDCEVTYPHGASHGVSLLSLPLGTGTVLDYLAERLEKVGHGEILVLSNLLGEGDSLPEAHQSGPLPIRMVTHENLVRALDRYEASDHLLIVDPRLWPVGGYDFADCQNRAEAYSGATHLVAIGGNGEGARERVECDGSGNVRRVQRLYAAKNWAEISGSSITHSIVPLRATMGLRISFPQNLRAALAATGVLSQDVPQPRNVLRLGLEAGFLALSERTVSEICRRPHVQHYHVFQREVLTGRGCRILAGARLVPPVIVQPGSIIEGGATIIGPTVIGAGVHVMQGATVIQSVLAGGAVIAPDLTVRQRVVWGEYWSEEEQAGLRGVRMSGLSPGADMRGGQDPPALGSASVVSDRWLHRAIKRSMDVVLSALALLILSPLLAATAILVKLDSRGPVFFAHYREGRKGKEFPCWKFRTMVADAHQRQRMLYKHSEVDGPQFKMQNDPRVTRVGRWLRGTNVDELPQLINVLLGHMSLVGPRPSPFRENQICVPWRLARLSVRPGISGLWQVCRDEDRLKGDFHEWIFYDMTYVRHFSIGLDLKILVATVFTLGGRWSVPLSWLLPKVAAQGREAHRYSVSLS